jgi:hypothetical protein
VTSWWHAFSLGYRSRLASMIYVAMLVFGFSPPYESRWNGCTGSGKAGYVLFYPTSRMGLGMKYRAVLFNFREGITKDVFWEGPDYVTVVDTLEAELFCGEEFTETKEIDVGGVPLLMWYTGPCQPQPEGQAWRIDHREHWSNIYFGNALFFPLEDRQNPYSGWVGGDCPLTCAQVAAHIVLLKHSEDFSEVRVVGTPVALDYK